MHNYVPPAILTDVGLNMFVDTIKLRELPLSVINVNIEKLLWHFDMPVWNKDGTDDWNLTPQEVVDKVPGTLVHQKRISQADETFPILLTEYKSKLVILDGIHRLVKIYTSGSTTIKAKLVPAIYLSNKEFQT